MHSQQLANLDSTRWVFKSKILFFGDWQRRETWCSFSSLAMLQCFGWRWGWLWCQPKEEQEVCVEADYECNHDHHHCERVSPYYYVLKGVELNMYNKQMSEEEEEKARGLKTDVDGRTFPRRRLAPSRAKSRENERCLGEENEKKLRPQASTVEAPPSKLDLVCLVFCLLLWLCMSATTITHTLCVWYKTREIKGLKALEWAIGRLMRNLRLTHTPYTSSSIEMLITQLSLSMNHHHHHLWYKFWGPFCALGGEIIMWSCHHYHYCHSKVRLETHEAGLISVRPIEIQLLPANSKLFAGKWCNPPPPEKIEATFCCYHFESSTRRRTVHFDYDDDDHN